MIKITITQKQAKKYNDMLEALRTIAGTGQTSYMTPDQLRKSEDCEFHGYDELITMTYENIQALAKQVTKGTRNINC